MNFSDWSEALPFGLAVGRNFARRQPFQLDVESVVMMALWKAQTRGAIFSRAYVALRVRGAMQDEMRTLAEGQRHNYQSTVKFRDIDDHADRLRAESEDPVERIDRERALEALPKAARYLVDQIASGVRQDQLAERLGVSAPRVNQVVNLLKADPSACTRLPGGVDLFEEIRRAHRRMVTRAYAATGTVTGVARALHVSVSDASRWVNQRQLVLPQKFRDFPDLREKARKLVHTAFVRANGSPATAGRLLSIDCSMASVLGREFAPDVFRSNRRPDITTESVARLCRKGWSQERIASHFGVSEHAIANRVRRGQLPTLLRTRPELPDSAFAELRAAGLKHREIAKRLNVSMNTVWVRLHRAKGLAKCGVPRAEATA
jgi:DNA-directed RNA polymerase specialized sigma24 family protein